MEYVIKDCCEEDLPQLVELCGKHADYEKTSYNPNGKQDLLKRALFTNNPKLFCLIVESNREAVGYASYTFDFSTWDASHFLYLDCLYLEPGARGFNIGESIIKKLVVAAKHNGCINIQWQTPDFNERAIKFYKRIGGIGKEKLRFFLTV